MTPPPAGHGPCVDTGVNTSRPHGSSDVRVEDAARSPPRPPAPRSAAASRRVRASRPGTLRSWRRGLHTVASRPAPSPSTTTATKTSSTRAPPRSPSHSSTSATDPSAKVTPATRSSSLTTGSSRSTSGHQCRSPSGRLGVPSREPRPGEQRAGPPGDGIHGEAGERRRPRVVGVRAWARCCARSRRGGVAVGAEGRATSRSSSTEDVVDAVASPTGADGRSTPVGPAASRTTTPSSPSTARRTTTVLAGGPSWLEVMTSARLPGRQPGRAGVERTTRSCRRLGMRSPLSRRIAGEVAPADRPAPGGHECVVPLLGHVVVVTLEATARNPLCRSEVVQLVVRRVADQV